MQETAKDGAMQDYLSNLSRRRQAVINHASDWISLLGATDGATALRRPGSVQPSSLKFGPVRVSQRSDRTGRSALKAVVNDR